MMRRALLLASLFAASPALAAQIPAPDRNDQRERHAVFNGDIIEVHAAEARSLIVKLCPGDTANDQSVAAGVLSVPDPTQKGADGKPGLHYFWEPAPLGNVMTIKPDDLVATNMQLVATTAAGAQRVYQFDLIPHEKITEPVDPKVPNGEQKVVAWYSIDFRCPDDEKAAARARWRARQAAAREQADQAEAQTARDRLSTDSIAGRARNWGYSIQTGAAK